MAVPLDRSVLIDPAPSDITVVDDDPDRDLGALRQPGHRFVCSPLEVEPLDSTAAADTVEGA
jgi:hypothetical protein